MHLSLTGKLKRVERVSVIVCVCYIMYESKMKRKEVVPPEGTSQYKAAVKIQMLLNYKGIKINGKCHESIC